jgi:transposase
MVQMKNKISLPLMEAGVSYNKQRLALLRLCRETVVRLEKTDSALIRSLERDPFLVERVEHLMSIPAVGPITALTWALE